MSERKEIKLNVVKLVLVIQLIVFGIIGLDKIGIDIPIIREVIVFIYLIFIPGLLILKNLGLEVSTPMKLLLLSITTSVSTLTILSTLENIILSPFYDKPISEEPLMVTIYGFTIFLTLVCLCRGNQYLNLIFLLNLQQVRLFLFFSFILLLMIVGKIKENKMLIFISLVVISIFPIIITLRKIDERVYPFIIWIISLCLLLLTEPPAGVWKTGEVVKITEIWDSSYPLTHNSLVSIVLLHPVFSILTGINVAVITNIVDTLLVSLIPVSLYMIYNKFFSPVHSFLASLVFSFYPFYPQLLNMNRTGFAFLFVSLFFLILLSKEVNLRSKRLLLIIFTFSIITSHYGTTYLFMLVLIQIFIMYLYNKKFRNIEDGFISSTFVTLLFTLSFSWYLYTSKAVNFEWGVGMYRYILTNLQDFFNPEESAAVRAFVTRSLTPSFSLEATKWLLFMLFIFIIIGAIKILYLYIKNKVNVIYAILTFSFCSALAGITQMGMPRIFGFSLLLTAPLALWGLSKILMIVKVKNDRMHLLAFSTYLFTLFAFTYGFVANSINAITGEIKDMALYGNIKEKMLESDNIYFKRLIYWGWQPDSTYKAVGWFFIHYYPNKMLFVDSLVLDSHLFTLHIPKEYGGVIVCNLTQPNVKSIEDVLKDKVRMGYVFLAYHNLHDNFIYVADMKGNEFYYRTSNYKWIFEKMNKIYDSCGGTFYIAS